jgi:hypothetical protein
VPISTTFRVNGASLVTEQFVETGFYRGVTAVCAHYAGFKRVASVELDRDLYERGLELPLVADGKILLYHGSSPDVLPEMTDPSLRTLVYLDGHFMGPEHGAVDPKYGECPILDEIHVLMGLPWDDMPTVVVDDIHLFRRPWAGDLLRRFDQKQWPELERVKRLFPAGYRFVEDFHTLYALPEQ